MRKVSELREQKKKTHHDFGIPLLGLFERAPDAEHGLLKEAIHPKAFAHTVDGYAVLVLAIRQRPFPHFYLEKTIDVIWEGKDY